VIRSWQIGEALVVGLTEYFGPVHVPNLLFPAMDHDVLRSLRSQFEGVHWFESVDRLVIGFQIWILHHAGRVILIDTGVGNHKNRPAVEPWHRLSLGYLGRLAEAGVRPEDVDLVVNTHLHSDHVGGNTRPAGDGWVPAFPNARYLIHEADFAYWNPVNGHVPRSPFHSVPDVAAMFEHSVLPVHRAGQAVLWGGDSYRIDDDLVVESAPGHTPGSAVIRLESGPDRALFVGDMIHSPLQLIEPDHEICVSEDRAEAVRSRRRVLDRAAATNSLVVPAHFGGAGAAEVVRSGGTFAIKGWAPDPQH